MRTDGEARGGARRLLSHGEFFGRYRERVAVAGFALAGLRADPRLDVQRHTHDTAHFILFLSGAYVTSARGAPEVCVRPTLIYNPPGTTHRDRFREEHGRVDGRFFSISISAERMARIADQVPLAEAAVCLDAPHALALARRLARECRAWDSASPLVAEGLCLELAACAARRGEPLGSAPPRWLQRARELLRDRSADGISIGDVARECGVHPVHLARAFRRFFDCSPGAYLRRCRLERAAALLRERREGIGEVALRAGFADQSHLTHAFRQAHGVTPAEYRRLLGGREV
jgi:AraC family transcriptional regulator